MDNRILPEGRYRQLLVDMADMHAIAGLVTKRRGMERVYFDHHKARGVRLRGKYRPQ